MWLGNDDDRARSVTRFIELSLTLNRRPMCRREERQNLLPAATVPGTVFIVTSGTVFTVPFSVCLPVCY